MLAIDKSKEGMSGIESEKQKIIRCLSVCFTEGIDKNSFSGNSKKFSSDPDEREKLRRGKNLQKTSKKKVVGKTKSEEGKEGDGKKDSYRDDG